MVGGIDVSSHQGTIDWKKVRASGVQFAMIRAGYGDDISQKDAFFDANMEGALNAGLEIGAYWFSYAVSAADAKKEAAVFRQVLAPYRGRMAYPAAFDYEYDSRDYARRQGADVTPELINQMADAFLGAMKSDGWKTALYTNGDFRRNVFSPGTLAAWDLWLADYSAGDPETPCAIRQTGDGGHVDGISGGVDTDTAYQEYAPSVRLDTTGVYRIAPGGVYQLKTTCTQPPKVWSGSKCVVVLPRFRSGNDDLWWIVATGKPGEGAGIYAAAPGEAGQRRLIVEITDPA